MSRSRDVFESLRDEARREHILERQRQKLTALTSLNMQRRYFGLLKVHREWKKYIRVKKGEARDFREYLLVKSTFDGLRRAKTIKEKKLVNMRKVNTHLEERR